MATVTSNTFNVDVRALGSVDQPWGFGRDKDGDNATGITGGRGNPLYFVTNLNGSGSGSLQQAMNDVAGTGGGNIVFEIGGEIDKREGVSSTQLDIAAGNTTVWGETAPGGVGIHGLNARVDVEQSNTILRHLAIRLDDLASGGFTARDAVFASSNDVAGTTAQNLLFVNCSISGSSDECVTVRRQNSGALPIQNVSFYRCLFSWPLRDSGRAESHNKWPLLNGIDGLSIIQCMFVCGEGRPALQAYGTSVVSNSLFYAWSGTLMNLSDFYGQPTIDAIFENNRIVTDSTHINRYSGAFPLSTPTLWLEIRSNVSSTSKVYINGNIEDGVSVRNLANSSVLVGADTGITKPNDYDAELLSASSLDSAWMTKIGANPSARDSWDQQAIDAVINEDGRHIDDVEETDGTWRVPANAQSGGFPVYPNDGQTHLALNGQSLENYIDSQIGLANINDVAPGFTNKTKLEALLENFQAGVPG